MNVIIKGTNIKLSVAMQEFIKEKIVSVAKFYPNIMEARVEIEHNLHHRKGDTYRCEVNLSVPGKLIRVEKTTPDFQKSVNKVKDHLKVVLSKERSKQLQKRKRLG